MWFHRQLRSTIHLMLFGCALASWPLHADESQPRPDSHRYGGITLADWRSRIVDFDADSPRAAQAVAPLLSIVADDRVDDVTRKNAAIALGNIGEPARIVSGQLMKMAEGDQADAIWSAKALSLMGAAARDETPRLTKLVLDDTRPLMLRQLALETLGLIGGTHPGAVPALIQVVSEGDESALRSLAAEALGVAGRDAAVAAPILVRIIRNPRESDELRRQSVIALGKFGDQAAVAVGPLVETLMIDDSEAVRDAAALSLAGQGPGGERILMSLLAEAEADIRWRAAVALGELQPRNRQAIAALKTALNDRDERVQLRACQSLVNLKAPAAHILPTTLSLMQSEDRMTRVDAVEVLVSLGDDAKAALPVLAEFARSGRDDVQRAAELAIKRMNAEEVPE